MNKKHFELLRVVIAITALLACCILMGLEIIKADEVPNPIVTESLDACCCSEERMISIYEGTESLEDSYELVMECVLNQDSVNSNAIAIKQMWEDSLETRRLESISTKPQ